MKIFLDTASLEAIKKYIPTGLIDGVTTNPTHLSKESGDITKHILQICDLLPQGQISVEITEQEPEAVYLQAKKIAALAPNVVVKIPCHAMYYSIIKKLVKEDIAINITLVFSLAQALMMSKLGVRMISPFLGRLDDAQGPGSGIQVLEQMRLMLDINNFETELLAASIRSMEHIDAAIVIGADSITLPVQLLEQAMQHPLTDKGMQLFDADWNKLGIKQFP
jgi:transaldolase